MLKKFLLQRPFNSTNIREMTSTTKFGRRDSLVKQASLDRIQLEGIKRRNTIRHRKQLEKSILCKQVCLFLIAFYT